MLRLQLLVMTIQSHAFLLFVTPSFKLFLALTATALRDTSLLGGIVKKYGSMFGFVLSKKKKKKKDSNIGVQHQV